MNDNNIIKANKAYESARYKVAIRLFMKSLRSNESNEAVLVKIARCYLGLLDLENAISAAKKVIALNPESVEAFYTMGVSLVYKQDFINAEKYIAHAIELDRESSLAHHGRGILYMGQDKLDLSIESLSYALKLDPLQWRSYLMLAEAYRRKGDMSKAINQNRIAFKVRPSLQNFHQLLVSAGLKYSFVLRVLNALIMVVLFLTVSFLAIPLAFASLGITLLGASIHFQRGSKTEGVFLLLFGLFFVAWYFVRLISSLM